MLTNDFIFVLLEAEFELFIVFCVDLVICPIIMQRDGEDMVELVRNCQNEFKEYYIQMQAAKRSQAPHPSQVMRISMNPGLSTDRFIEILSVISEREEKKEKGGWREKRL